MTMRLILFDLDGTLADTAPDMAAALNALRRERGRPPLPCEDIRPLVSHGTPALLRLGFGIDRHDTGYPDLRDRFLALYAGRRNAGTRLFPGMAELLAALEDGGIAWGVVTNKPGFLARPLLAKLGLDGRLAALVCGDCLPRNKPHPDPLLEACRLAGIQASDTVYVGDAERDIQAATAAGMPAVIAGYGYIGPAETPAGWGAVAMIEQAADLLAWLQQQGLPAQSA